MLNIIKLGLLQYIKDIDSGNSNISESQQEEIINFMQNLNRQELTKIEEYNYINKSRATFDNYIKRGLIPEGHKRQGTNIKTWNKKDLDKFLKK